MDLADFGSPETLIGVILKHHSDMSGRILVEAISASVGTAEIRYIEAYTYEGALDGLRVALKSGVRPDS